MSIRGTPAAVPANREAVREEDRAGKRETGRTGTTTADESFHASGREVWKAWRPSEENRRGFEQFLDWMDA